MKSDRSIVFLAILFLSCAILTVHSTSDDDLNTETSVITPIPLDFPVDFRIQDFNITDPGVLTKFKGQYKDVAIRGLNDMTLESIKFNLEWMHADVIFQIPHLEVKGLYSMNGQYMLIPFNGRGPFDMHLRNVKVYTTASLRRREDKAFEVSQLVLEMTASKVRGNFDRLFGRQNAAVISDIVHMMTRQIGEIVFDHMKGVLAKELDERMRLNLNRMLKQMPDKFVHEQTTAKFDFLIDAIRKEIVKSHHDPLILENVTESVDQDLGLFRFKGQLDLRNRILYGLSTIFRSGHVFAHYDLKKNSIILETNLGFENLTATNNFDAKLIDRQGPKGSSEITVNSVVAFMRIRQHLTPGSQPILEDFSINRIGKIWVDIKGLGSPWDGVVETIINLISNSFKYSLSRIISGPIKTVLQKEIDRLHFDYFLDTVKVDA